MIAFLAGFTLASIIAAALRFRAWERTRKEREATTANLGAWLTRKELTSNDAWQTPDGAWWTIDGRVGRKA